MRGPAPDVARGGLPRAAVVLSIVLHVLAFLFAVGVPRLLSSGPSGNKVYVVDLVGLPGSPAAAPAPPAAAPPAPEPPKPAPTKAPEPKPVVKKEPPKKAPVKPIVLPDKNVPKKTTKTPEKPPEKKAPEPAPKPAEPQEKETDDEATGEEQTADAAAQETPASTAPAKPGAVPGTAPGTGTGAGAAGPGSGTGGGDELQFYYALLKRRIETAWKRPVSTSRETRTAAVYIQLSPTGRLLKLELKTPSGFAPFDRSIIQAVRDAEPFPPVPLGVKMDAVILEFELTPLGGDAP